MRVELLMNGSRVLIRVTGACNRCCVPHEDSMSKLPATWKRSPPGPGHAGT